MEKWKEIPGYEGIYEASTYGRIRTAENKTTCNSKGIVRHWKQRVLKTKKTHSIRRSEGVLEERITLYKDGKPKDFKVSRLVAMAWCDGYAPNLTVNHKDCDPTNNRADNLEWRTNLENVRHGIEHGCFKKCYRPITILVDGEMRSFPTMKAASLALGKSPFYLYTKVRSKHGKIELGVDG
jgi:NUMOD4 motif.